MHIDHDYQVIDAELKAEFRGPYPELLEWYPDRIRKLRISRSLKQSDFWKLAGISQPRMSYAETGKKTRYQKAKDAPDSDIPHPRMETIALFAISKILKCPLGEIAKLPQPSEGTITSEQIRKLESVLLDVEKVHSLIKPGEKIFLRDYYFQTKLKDRVIPKTATQAPRPSFVCHQLEDLPSTASVVLGVAGQGKSIFLRYLTIQEALKAQSLPLFFELRLLQDLPLKSQILRRLQNWKLCDTLTQMEIIFDQSQVSLLFDAYDELASQDRQRFLADLAELHETYPRLRIIVTSRPDSGILECDWLHPYSILPYEPDDVLALIKLYADERDWNVILEGLKSTDIQITELLQTAIFVVLLVVNFEHSRTVPKNLVAFFHDLVDALIRRHNRSESGHLKRPISSKLKPRQIQQIVFELSYRLYSQQKVRRIHLYELTQEMDALLNAHRYGRTVDAELVVDDIIKITNLIFEEGGICTYIHKTVCEYYAAAYISGQKAVPEAQAIYDRLQSSWRDWLEVLAFLEVIDRRRYLLYFGIPGLKKYVPFTSANLASSFQQIKVVSDKDKHTDFFALRLLGTRCHAFLAYDLRVDPKGTNLLWSAVVDCDGLMAILGESRALKIVEVLKSETESSIDTNVDLGDSDQQIDFARLAELTGLTSVGDRFRRTMENRLMAWEKEVG